MQQASIRIRITVATVLCLSILFYLPLRTTMAREAATPSLEVQSESQYRSEASRYNAAVRAIGAIATANLETLENLKKALAIVDQERPNLTFHRSKLVAMAISDSTFAAAVRKQSPNIKAAESLIKQMAADKKALLTLDGAAALQTRMQRSDESDSAVLRRAGQRLKDAAKELENKAQVRISPEVWGTQDGKIMHTGFRELSLTSNSMAAPQDPATIAGAIFIGLVVIDVVLYGALIIKNVSSEEGRDLIAECQANADARYLRCLDGANAFQRAICYGSWLIDQAGCLVTPK